MKKLLVLAVVLATVAYWTVQKAATVPGPLTETAEVVIPRGANSRVVAAKLAEARVIRNQALFRLWARFNGLDKKLKAGEYQFKPRMPLRDVMHKIAAGDVFFRRITLAEGLTTREMLELIEAEPMLEGEITLTPKEGELLPETYSFMRGDKRDRIVRQAAEAMHKVKEEAWAARAPGLPLKNAEEMMVLASIIEKETGIAEERELVASVFVNRLLKGMRLQTDPTVIYALTKGQQDLGRSLTRKDLEIDSPYNTYKYYGLPPAPICNPGAASIRAAVTPEVSAYLYFVATGNGGHNFAESLAEHNQNVQSWRKQRKK